VERAEPPADRRRPVGRYGAIAALAFLSLAAIAAVVIVYSVMSSQISELEDRVGESEQALVAAQKKVDENAADLRESGTAQIEQFKEETEASLTQVSNTAKTLNTKVTRIQECLPELQTFIDGMSVSTSDYQGYVTGAYLSYGQQMSRRCATLFRPGANQPGG